MKRTNYLLLFLGLLLCHNFVYAQSFTSNKATANFTDSDAWLEGIPNFDGTETFTILNGHSYVFDQDASVLDLTVNTGGSVETASGGVFTLLVKGNLVVEGSLDLYIDVLEQTSLAWHSDGTDRTISGEGTIQLGNITFKDPNSTNDTAVSYATSVDLDIQGNVTIEENVRFIGGIHTITVGGGWTEVTNQAFYSGSGDGTVIFTNLSAIALSSDNTNNDLEFNHLELSGGGIVNFGAEVKTEGDFWARSNTTIFTGLDVEVKGDFTVETGSSFTQSNNQMAFAGSTSQTITLDGDVTFYLAKFENGDSNAKTVVGDLVADNELRILSNAILQTSDKLTFRAIRLYNTNTSSTTGITGDIEITGGGFYFNNASTDGLIDLSNSKSIRLVGNGSVEAGDDLIVNNLYVENGTTLTINEGATLIGLSTSIFSLEDNARLTVKGTDNFPNGFATSNYKIHENSTIYYNGAIDQNIEATDSDWNYGNLYLDEATTKILTDDVVVLNNLYLRGNAVLDLSTHNFNLGGNIENESGGSITSVASGYGTFTLDGIDNSQSIEATEGGSYDFGKFSISKSGLTDSRTVTFGDDIKFKENFTVTNTGGAENTFLNVNLKEYTLTSETLTFVFFTIGAFVELQTASETEFIKTDYAAFTGKAFSSNSTILFNGVNQLIPSDITYHNIHFSNKGNKTANGTLNIDGDVAYRGSDIVFVDNSNTITVSGDWLMSPDRTNMTGSIEFDGTDQTIQSSNFNNITFGGTGTKIITGTQYIAGNVTINDGVTVSAIDESLFVAGNWTENGTAATFTQRTGTTTLESNQFQNIQTTSKSTFGNLTVKNNNTIGFNSDIIVSRNLNLNKNNAFIDLDANTLFIGRYFSFDEGTTIDFTTGATIHFNGNEEQQIQNENKETLPSLIFSGNGKKTIAKVLTVQGDITIDKAYLDANSQNITLSGDWNNTGIFESTNTVEFNGTDHAISTSNFHNLLFSGTGVATLGGNIVLSSSLEIGENATLDVSANNYEISLEESWINKGVFEARSGTVRFTGDDANVYAHPTEKTGEYDAYNFYNVVIELATTNALYLYSTFDVDNDLYINSGTLTSRDNHIYVGGDFINNATFNYSNTNSLLTLNANSGNHLFKAGTSEFGSITIDATGAIYELQSDLAITKNNSRFLTIEDGELSLNGNNIKLSKDTDIQINGGVFHIDEGADLFLGQDAVITNAGGEFKVVGTEDLPATIASSDPDANDYFTFVQTSGTIHVKYYIIQNSRDGLDLQGGTIDTEDNFSNGIFSDGTGDQYLKLNSIAFADFEVSNIVFNEGATHNVQRTAGASGVITFKDFLGSLSGEAYEDDAGSLIEWNDASSVAIKWDGGAGDNDWNTATNWSTDVVPSITDNVVLDNTFTPNYTVNIPSDIQIADLDINGNLTLTLNSNTLDIVNFTFTNGTFNLSDGELQVEGNYILASSATLDPGTSTVKFDGLSGASNLISVAGSNESFYNISFDAVDDETRYMVSSDLNILGDFTLNTGLFDILTANKIHVEGDWLKNGGIFQAGTGSVEFAGMDQSISGGVFHDVIFGGGGNKTLSSNMTIENDLTILNDAGTILKGEDKLIFIKGNWTNNNISAAFEAGTSAVYFNGGTQHINGESEFSTLYFTGSGDKYFNNDVNILKELLISFEKVVHLEDGVSVTGNASANLEMTNGTLGVKGSNNFPSNFATYQLLGGTVEYKGDLDQDIYQIAYHNLTLNVPNSTNYNKNLLGDITVNGRLEIKTDNTVFNVNGHTIELEEGFSVPSSPVINWGAGTLLHKGGSWNMDSDLTTFHHLILGGTDTKTLKSSLTITGNVIVEDGVRLNMQNFEMDGATGSFTLEGESILKIGEHPSISDPAFPNGFAHYSLSEASIVELNATGDKILPTEITFGRLNLRGTVNAKLSGDLDVNGIFDMDETTSMDDVGYDLYLGGSWIDIQNYIASTNSTVYFDGGDQRIRNDLNSGSESLDFYHVVFDGTREKLLNGTNDIWNITGDLTIEADAEVSLNRQMNISGTITNNGSFIQTSNSFGLEFNGSGTYNLDFGVTNELRDVYFNGGTFNLVSNGMYVERGYVNISPTSTVDFGTLTHKLASETHSFNGTIISADASFNFVRRGEQYLPNIDLTFEDFTLGGSGHKYLPSNTYNIDDLHVEGSAHLRLSDDDGVTLGTLIVRGNWLNEGDVSVYNSHVYFDSDDTDSKTITSGGNVFYNLTLNENLTNARTYQILDELAVTNELVLKANATLDVRGNALNLGNDDTDYPLGEVHTIEANAALNFGENGILLFDGNDQDQTLNVSGTLSFVGSAENLAKIERDGNGRRLAINILSGGTIGANYYEFAYLAHTGMIVNNGANIHSTNNFSNGLWTGISSSNSGDYRYLQLDNDFGADITIQNIMFNHDDTPKEGTHYNVGRISTASGVVTFDGQVNGRLAGVTYEDDAGDLIEWSGASDITWIGAISADWETAANWSTGTVPTTDDNIVIPLGSPNNPIIASGSSVTSNKLTITNGILSLSDGASLDIASDLTIGTGSYAGVVIVDGNANINLEGSLDMANNAMFKGAESTFNFTPLAGTVNLTANATSEFGDVVYNGDVDFRMIGEEIHILGSMTLSNGNLAALTSGYTHYIAKDVLNNGGIVSGATRGLFILNGADQTIRDFTFYDLQVDGTSTKTFEGTNTIENDLVVKSTLATTSTATLHLMEDVTIEGSGTFDDGGSTHYFYGPNWIGEGAYTGAGTIAFVDNSDQYIGVAKFNNLDLNLSDEKNVRLEGDVDITGDVYLRSSISNLITNQHLIESTNGVGEFLMEDGARIQVQGANNFPNGFNSYNLDENSITYYNGVIDQTIKGGLAYGRVELANPYTKTLDEDVTIKGKLNISDATLDVSTNNYTLTLYNDFQNNNTGSFIARNGEVIFGAITAPEDTRQDIYLSADGTKDFYDLTVNSEQVVNQGYSTLNILNNFRIDKGGFRIADDDDHLYVSGNVTIQENGDFETRGTLNLIKSTGPAFITSGGSTFNHVIVNGDADFSLEDEFALNGNFTQLKGSFDLNGHTANLGNGADVMTISSTFKVGEGSQLILGNNASFEVTQTGRFEAIGISDTYANIEAVSGGRYSFIVNGTIAARYYNFSDLNINGLTITSNGFIDVTDNFSYGSFSRGVGGGTYLRIENSQDLIGTNRIEEVSFVDDPKDGATNVTKITTNTGTVEFYNARGNLSGENFDNDPYGLISFIGDETLTWNGSISEDWFLANNWTSNLGAGKVPTGIEDVIIPSTAVIAPVINSSTSALAKSLDIESGAFLSVMSEATGTDLLVSGDITIAGIFTNTGNDVTIEVQGNWAKSGNSSVFSAGTSTVELNTNTGSKYVNNLASTFYNLVITNGHYIFEENTILRNDLTIAATAILEIDNTNPLDVYLAGNLINQGVFTPNTSIFYFNSKDADTKTILSGGVSFNDVYFQSTVSNTYQLLDDFIADGSAYVDMTSIDLNTNNFSVGVNDADKLEITNGAIVEVNGGETLALGTASDIEVTNGGKLHLVGTSTSERAILTSRDNSAYSLKIASEAYIKADYYGISYLDEGGLQILNGANIEETSTGLALTNGEFSNGASIANAKYINVETNLGSGLTFSDVRFNTGPTYNVVRESGTGVLTVFNSTGALSGYPYEKDDEAIPSNTTGLILWKYDNDPFFWQGDVSTDWHTASNWDRDAVPQNDSEVFIPQGSPNNVIVSIAKAEAKGLTLQTNGQLTLTGGHELVVADYFDINGQTFTVQNGSTSTISVGENILGLTGVTDFGDASTVELNSNSIVPLSLLSVIPFNNLTLKGTATYQTDNLELEGNLLLEKGGLDLLNSTSKLTVSGDVDVQADASLDISSGELSLDGGNQSITFTGTSSLNDFTIAGTGTKTLKSDVSIHNLSIANSNTALSIDGGIGLTVLGDWTNYGGFTHGNGTVSFEGNQLQSINQKGTGNFYNLNVNSMAPGFAINLNDAIALEGQLTFTDGIIIGGTNETVTFKENATAVNASNSSYIDGVAIKEGNADFSFPIGKNGILGQLKLSNLGTNSTFKVQYLEGNANDLPSSGFNEAGVLGVSEVEYWDVQRLSGVAEPEVALYWADNERSVIHNLDELLIAELNTNDNLWHSIGGVETGAAPSSGWLTSEFPLSNFGYVTFGTTSKENLLPISLLYFSANYEGGEVLLEWETASELGNDFFTVERSIDGVNYEAIEEIKGAGDSNQILYYSAIDENPYHGISYYRLKQTNFDRISTYSVVVSVSRESNLDDFSMKLYPNPLKDQQLNLELGGLQKDEKISLIVFDVYGRKVMVEAIKANHAGFIDWKSDQFSNLSAGLYVLIIETKRGIVQQRLIVK